MEVSKQIAVVIKLNVVFENEIFTEVMQEYEINAILGLTRSQNMWVVMIALRF